jgi:hypothetical protein
MFSNKIFNDYKAAVANTVKRFRPALSDKDEPVLFWKITA